ncbi:hypothetical protein BJ944DRAFT_9384 [Cunninghamella echinulata]|nr:hypothetical protein BJ944DRAFT_9384 [Cunninghamella echinulata]
MTICFWGLLSAKDLEIIYIARPIREQTVLNEYNNGNNITNFPTINNTTTTTTTTTTTPTIQDLILNRSLYEFIHPEERALAQNDLSCFLRRKTLLGAVTRCRLRSFQSIAKSLYSNQPDHGYVEEPYTWNIVNVVTYSVTDHIVLAFFHNSDNDLDKTICGEQAFNSIDTTILLSILYKYHPVDSTTVTTTTTTNNRTFQIYDRSLKNRYISWPPSSFYHNNDLDTSLKDNYHSSTNSCMQHAHTQSLIIHPTSPSSSSTSFSTSSSSAISSSSTITMNDTPSYKLERIVINYGGITFYTFETTAIYPPSSSSSHATYAPSNDSQYPFIKLSSSSSKIDFPPMNNNNNNTMKLNHIPSPPKQVIEPRRHSAQHNQSRNNQDRICYECGRQSSLEWRRGPAGHKT